MLFFGLGGLFYGENRPSEFSLFTDLRSRGTPHQRYRDPLGRQISCSKYAHPSSEPIEAPTLRYHAIPLRIPLVVYFATGLYSRRVRKLILILVGWTASAADPGFGGQRDDASIKARLINLVSSVRTLMRSMYS